MFDLPEAGYSHIASGAVPIFGELPSTMAEHYFQWVFDLPEAGYSHIASSAVPSFGELPSQIADISFNGCFAPQSPGAIIKDLLLADFW